MREELNPRVYPKPRKFTFAGFTEIDHDSQIYLSFLFGIRIQRRCTVIILLYLKCAYRKGINCL